MSVYAFSDPRSALLQWDRLVTISIYVWVWKSSRVLPTAYERYKIKVGVLKAVVVRLSFVIRIMSLRSVSYGFSDADSWI